MYFFGDISRIRSHEIYHHEFNQHLEVWEKLLDVFPGIEQANPEYNWVKWGETTVLSGRKLKMEPHGNCSYNTMYKVGPGSI